MSRSKGTLLDYKHQVRIQPLENSGLSFNFAWFRGVNLRCNWRETLVLSDNGTLAYFWHDRGMNPVTECRGDI